MQGSVLVPVLFNIYANDQPKSEDTQRFIHADNLGISAQHTDFTVVEQRLSKALDDLTPYNEIKYPVPIHPRHRCAFSTSETVKLNVN